MLKLLQWLLSTLTPKTSEGQKKLKGNGEMVKFNPPIRKVTKVFLHCSATDNPKHDDVSVIRQWHKDKGWRDIGYHYFITSKGDIQRGRDLNLLPAAQKGHNRGSIAICLHGLAYFDETQFDALRELCDVINRAYSEKVTFHGHNEVSNKACPVFDYRAVLNLDDDGQMQ